MPLPPPYHPGDGFTMEVVTDQPGSTKSGYTGILVIVDGLTTMAIYLPCHKDINSPQLARMIFDEVICKHGVQNKIITDCGTHFTSRFENRVCSHMNVDHRPSTAFHRQTDGLNEQQNQTMEQYLRTFSKFEQDNWAELLLLVESAYNNSVHASTRMTPFWALYHRNPEMQFKPPKVSHLKSENLADATLEGLAERHRTL